MTSNSCNFCGAGPLRDPGARRDAKGGHGNANGGGDKQDKHKTG